MSANNSWIRRLFQTDESRFLLSTALKIWGISVLVELIVGYILYMNIRLNFYFFRSHGYKGIDNLGEAYFQHVLSDIIEALPWILGFHIVIFFMGLYIGHMMLRPFKRLGEYCSAVIDNPDAIYRVEEFSAYRIYVRFSELFFDHIRSSRKNKMIEPREIPTQYQGIHKPILDGAFLFHFMFFLIIIMVVTIISIMRFALEIHEKTSLLAIRMLNADAKMLTEFYFDQSFWVDEMWFLTAILVVILHVVLGLHLYSQVSGAAFGIFATMRSFMKGRWESRVHLVGYYYVRESTRMLNKYLDWVQKNLVR